jgi:hypothetical protein
MYTVNIHIKYNINAHFHIYIFQTSASHHNYGLLCADNASLWRSYGVNEYAAYWIFSVLRFLLFFVCIMTVRRQWPSCLVLTTTARLPGNVMVLLKTTTSHCRPNICQTMSQLDPTASIAFSVRPRSPLRRKNASPKWRGYNQKFLYNASDLLFKISIWNVHVPV